MVDFPFPCWLLLVLWIQTCINDALNFTWKFRLAVTGYMFMCMLQVPRICQTHPIVCSQTSNETGFLLKQNTKKKRENPAFPGKRSSGAVVPSPIPHSACPQTSILLTHPSLILGNKWHPHMKLHQNRTGKTRSILSRQNSDCSDWFPWVELGNSTSMTEQVFWVKIALEFGTNQS